MPITEHILNDFDSHYIVQNNREIYRVQASPAVGLVNRTPVTGLVLGTGFTVSDIAVTTHRELGEVMFVVLRGPDAGERGHVERYRIHEDGYLYDRDELAGAVSEIYQVAADADHVYITFQTGGSGTIYELTNPFERGASHTLERRRAEGNAVIRGMTATPHKLYYVRDGSGTKSIVRWDILSDRTLDHRAEAMTPATTIAETPYLGTDVGNVNGMHVDPDTGRAVISATSGGTVKIYKLTVDADGDLTPVLISAGKPDSVSDTLAVTSLADLTNTSTINKGRASSLAYCYLLREDITYLNNGNVQHPDSDHTLILRDGDAATSQRVFEGMVSAARGGGYSRLNSPLTHEDTIYYQILDKNGDRKGNGTEWLIGLYEDPGPN